MPITPFHFGIGACVKAICPRRFSFSVFLVSQIVMDMQPGLYFLTGFGTLHGWTHTYLGALLLAVFVAIVWRVWEMIRPAWLATEAVSNSVLAASCFFGTLSHVWLDSQYHLEMFRLTPKWLKLIHADQVEFFCLSAVGLAGVIFSMRWIATRIFFRKTKTGG